MRKEVIVAYFKVLSLNLTGIIEEKHENPVRIVCDRNLPYTRLRLYQLTCFFFVFFCRSVVLQFVFE
jgi:hypothetical protein